MSELFASQKAASRPRLSSRFTREGMLVIISGPSGSGKGTVVKGLCANDAFALSVSVTTRKPRPDEKHGRDYFFTSEEDFIKMRENGELLEHALYVNNFYGTPRNYALEQIRNGKIVVLEIDVQGALQVRDKFREAVLVFLMPPSMDELAARLRARGSEDDVTIEARLKKAYEEIPLINKYDYLVVNDDVMQATCDINAIVAAEQMKPARSASLIQAFASEARIKQ